MPVFVNESLQNRHFFEKNGRKVAHERFSKFVLLFAKMSSVVCTFYILHLRAPANVYKKRKIFLYIRNRMIAIFVTKTE